jgi:hypothetical protein
MSSKVLPRPLNLKVIESKSVPLGEAHATLENFLSNEVAVHSLPNNISHQLNQVFNSLQELTNSN